MSEPGKSDPQSGRCDGWTTERQRLFLEQLAECGSVKLAARFVGMSTSGAYRACRRPGADAFRRAWDDAVKGSIMRLTDAAMERALNGVEVPIVAKGEVIGHRTVYNDRLLMFLLRQRDPLRYAPEMADPHMTWRRPTSATRRPRHSTPSSATRKTRHTCELRELRTLVRLRRAARRIRPGSP